MNWACDLTEDAQRDLRDLPTAVQKRVARVLDQMQTDPFQGDVKALQGEEWKGVFRRRLGNYRILFLPESGSRVVRILHILIRSGKTYR
jgi:mRNA-degrading endonuclease RelE of RelBE toxin-antitoxin system